MSLTQLPVRFLEGCAAARLAYVGSRSLSGRCADRTIERLPYRTTAGICSHPLISTVALRETKRFCESSREVWCGLFDIQPSISSIFFRTFKTISKLLRLLMMLPHSPHLRNQSTSWWVSSICTSWSNAHPAKIDSLSLKACQAKMQDNQATPSFPSCLAKKKKPQPASFGSLSGEEQSSAFQVEATKCLRGVRLCLEELPAKKEHRLSAVCSAETLEVLKGRSAGTWHRDGSWARRDPRPGKSGVETPAFSLVCLPGRQLLLEGDRASARPKTLSLETRRERRTGDRLKLRLLRLLIR